MKAGQRGVVGVLGVLALSVAACGAPASSVGATSTPEPEPTLGTVNATCQGCGEVAPASLTLEAYAEDGSVFGGVVFTKVRWRSWGSGRATAPATHAFFLGPGEPDTVTLYAFDPGTCGGRHGYRRLEWVESGARFDPARYYDTCTGKGVGAGFPGYPQ